jgi:arylsulfatase A
MGTSGKSWCPRRRCQAVAIHRLEGYTTAGQAGGTRVPGVIDPGTDSDELVCLTDLMVTCAEIVGADLPATAGEDSVSLMPLFSNCNGSNRSTVIHHSIAGKFAIRDGKWKLVLGPGSGGWTQPDPVASKCSEQHIEPAKRLPRLPRGRSPCRQCEM